VRLAVVEPEAGFLAAGPGLPGKGDRRSSGRRGALRYLFGEHETWSRDMKTLIALPLAAALLAVSGLAALAHHDTHRTHTANSPRDPNFNPLEFPLCFAWDPKLHRDVWVCGRSAY
jgi:hypothetical protein